MSACRTVLLCLTALRISAAITNPTHYGPDPDVGYDSQCMSDEKTGGWALGYNSSLSACAPGPCKQDSDCPTDKPSSNENSPYCDTNGNWVCALPCDTNDDCDKTNKGVCNSGICVYIRPPPLGCYYMEALDGKWVKVGSSSGTQEVDFMFGTSHTDSHAGTDSVSWGASATTSAQAGFSAFGVSGSVSVAGTISSTVGQTYSKSFATTQSSSTTFKYTFDAGVVWQWQFTVNDGCGLSTSYGRDMALTNDLLHQPCCIPGLFKEAKNATGDCLDGTPNLCSSTLWTGNDTVAIRA